MQEVRGDTCTRYIVLPLLVSLRFHVLFHSPLGVLFTFPSLYLFTIGHRIIFSLREWSLQIPSGFHVSVGTRDTFKRSIVFVHAAITLFGRPFQIVKLTTDFVTL